MRTILFFGPRLRSGCSTAAMALTAAWLSQGRRVLVVDMTEAGTSDMLGGPGQTTPLEKWANRVTHLGSDPRAASRQAVSGHELVVHRAGRYGGLADDLTWFASTQGFELAVIDGPVRVDEGVLAALAQADLVVAPFADLAGARAASRALIRHLPPGTPARGLATGLQGGAAEREAARAAFEAAPLLRAELPWCELFAAQADGGYLPDMVRRQSVWAPRRDTARWRPVRGFADHEAARRAWVAATTAAGEAWWAAHGFDLVARDGGAPDATSAAPAASAALPPSALALPDPVPPGLPATPARVLAARSPPGLGEREDDGDDS